MSDHIPQRQLAKDMVEVIDIARRPTKTAHTDQARRRLAVLMREQDWLTDYVTHHIGIIRMRWLMSQGNWQVQSFLRKEEDRMAAHGDSRRKTQEDN